MKKTLNQYILILSIALICMLSSTTWAWNFRVPAQEVKPSDGGFQFSAADFADGKARYYLYNPRPDKRIRFFIVKSEDGVIRAAFDACDVCFRSQKGYIQQGNEMVCVNCGLKFQTSMINEVKGGCNPAPLHRVIQNDQVIIREEDVLSGLRYFR
jgi:uncharacterized membrane protein